LSNTKLTWSDLFFGGQIFGACWFAIPQIWRSFSSVRAVSLGQLGLVAAFMAINLWLASDAYREARKTPHGTADAGEGRRSLQLIITYSLWLALSLGMVAAIALNPAYRLSEEDGEMVMFAGASTIAILLFSRLKGVPLADPMLKSLLGIAYKAVPQVLLASVILSSRRADGIPWETIAAGHFTAGLRVAQILLTHKSRIRFWLGVSEGANEGTWLLVTLAWGFVTFAR